MEIFKILFLGISLSSVSIAYAREADTHATKTTSTDSNEDGQSDGNAEVIHKDTTKKINYSVKVASANIRGSLIDAVCIDGSGERCSTLSHFSAGNMDGNFLQFGSALDVMNQNAFSRNRSVSGIQSPTTICTEVPSAFGCLNGDYTLLTSARESTENAIAEGLPLLPEGKEASGFLKIFDQFISKVSSFRNQLFNGFSEKMNLIGLKPLSPMPSSLSFSDFETQNSNSSSGAQENPLYTYDDYAKNNQEGSEKTTFGKTQWVGPKFLEDLSRFVFPMNKMDVTDRQNGKSLTVWQRATRRYQDSDLSRAFTLAKGEQSRHKLLQNRLPALSKKE